jgi:hypothetical protein
VYVVACRIEHQQMCVDSSSLLVTAASLGPTNWARWGYACIVGVALFAAYALAEVQYNRTHGPPPRRDMSYHDEQNYEQREAAGKSADMEAGKGIDDAAALADDQAAGSR